MITAFCILAEPEKLMYPYMESLVSVSHFCDSIVINYAANKSGTGEFRAFEPESYRKLVDFKEKVSSRCDVRIYLDETWKQQKDQMYEDWKNMFQRSLDDCKSGWFLKFDADNVFRKDKSKEIKDIFDPNLEKVIFRRMNVIDKDSVSMNYNSEDIYAINIDNLKNKSIPYRIGDHKEWCRVIIGGQFSEKIISDESLVPYNYDATFFTRERIVDFWRKTEEVYSNAEKRNNRFANSHDDMVLDDFIKYKKNKLGSILKGREHPQDIRERFESIKSDLWGHSNFR